MSNMAVARLALAALQPPELYVPAEGSELDATAPDPACSQAQAAAPPLFDEIPRISEDCLDVHLSRPDGTSSHEKLPVVVHIYSGGLVQGDAEGPLWDPDNLLTLSQSPSKSPSSILP